MNALTCPRCRSELVVTGHEKLETLNEHVMCVEPSIKAKLECSNAKCLTKMYGIFWNIDGERYSDHYSKFSDHDIFIDGNDAPFGSWARRVNVEINKKDENYTLLKIGRIWLRIKFLYKSNENGDILKRERKLEIWLRNRDERGKWGMYTYYISGLHMLMYALKGFYRTRKNFNMRRIDEKWGKKELIEFRDGYTWDKRWWRRVAQWWVRVFHCRLYKQLTSAGDQSG